MNYRFLAVVLLFCSCPGWQALSQQASVGSTSSSSLTPSATGSNAGIGSIFSPDLFNGTSNVSVPIYNYSTDNGNYGISLSYNTAGVKINELSGAIGLHFSLNSGGNGMINRVLKDMPDEMNTYDYVPVGGSDCQSSFCMGVKGKFAVYKGNNAPLNENMRYVDGESDDFVVSVGGLNFTFNLGADGFIFTHPHRNVKIDLLLDGVLVTNIPAVLGAALNNPNITFQITDEQGVQYFFEQGVKESRQYVANAADPAVVFSFPYISQWVIQKIILANGEEIKYNYNEWSGANRAGLYMAFEAVEEGGASIFHQEVKLGTTVISMKKIAAIDYPNKVKASFVYDIVASRTRCDNPGSPYDNNPVTDGIIREIKIAEQDNCLRYSMEQAYTVAPGSTPNTPSEIAWGSPCVQMGDSSYAYHRLILKGIRKLSCDGQQDEPYYSFVYDAQRLPSRYSGAQDYFGYYNGQSVTEFSGMLTIPRHFPPSGPEYGVIKDHNAVFATAGILRSVKNAYGGELYFDYDAHSLANVITGLPTSDPLFLGFNAVDGVRLKSITTRDKYYPGSYMVQDFTYSGGQHFLNGGYFHYPYSSAASRSFNGIYVSPHQLINGSNHGYRWVTVTSKDQSGNQFSRNVTEYTNFLNPVTGLPRYQLNGGTKHYYELPFTDRQYIRDWEIGLPVTQEAYDQNDKIVSRSVNEYTHTLDNTATIGKVENVKTMRYVNSDAAIVSEPYRPYTGKSFLTRTTIEKFVDNVTSVNDIVDYEYDERDNLRRTVTTNSKGEQIVARNVYNYEVSGPGVVGGNQPGSTLYAMTAAGIEKPVSMERWKTGTGTAPYNDVLLQASITGFTYDNQKIRTQKLHTLVTEAPVPYTSYTGITPGATGINPFSKVITAYAGSTPSGFELVSEVQAFDDKGNPLETKLPQQDVYKSMVWDKGSGRKVADVDGARYADMGYTSFESTLYDGIAYTGSELIQEGNFAYKQCGISGDAFTGAVSYRFNSSCASVTGSSLTAGKTYLVTFWAKNGVPVLSGAGLGTLTCQEANEAMGWKFYQARFTAASTAAVSLSGPTGTQLDDLRLFPVGAAMSSSTFEPMLGTTSVTDAGGRVTRYEYDKLGRQVLVRDQEGTILSKTEYHIAP